MLTTASIANTAEVIRLHCDYDAMDIVNLLILRDSIVNGNHYQPSAIRALEATIDYIVEYKSDIENVDATMIIAKELLSLLKVEVILDNHPSGVSFIRTLDFIIDTIKTANYEYLATRRGMRPLFDIDAAKLIINPIILRGDADVLLINSKLGNALQSHADNLSALLDMIPIITTDFTMILGEVTLDRANASDSVANRLRSTLNRLAGKRRVFNILAGASVLPDIVDNDDRDIVRVPYALITKIDIMAMLRKVDSLAKEATDKYELFNNKIFTYVAESITGEMTVDNAIILRLDTTVKYLMDMVLELLPVSRDDYQGILLQLTNYLPVDAPIIDLEA